MEKATGNLQIVSSSSAPFQDRHEAGKLLAAELEEYSGRKVVVLGIPRGGVVVAGEVARKLKAELDIVLARKLRTPGREELAMGSVAEDGKVFLNRNVVDQMGIEQADIEMEREIQMIELKRRTDMIRQLRPKIRLKDRTVIVIDDGVATGATTQAALWAVRLEHPEKLVAAIPVGPVETIRRLAEVTDEMICLRTPAGFMAVGQFYRRFLPVDDDDVMNILREGRGYGIGDEGPAVR